MLKAIFTFDQSMLDLDRMSADDASFAQAVFFLGWILGIDELDRLMYYEPGTGKTVAMDNQKGVQSMARNQDQVVSGSGLVAAEAPAAALAAEAPAAAQAAEAPAAEPAAPVPAEPAAPVPAEPAAAGPAAPETPQTPESLDTRYGATGKIR